MSPLFLVTAFVSSVLDSMVIAWDFFSISLEMRNSTIFISMQILKKINQMTVLIHTVSVLRNQGRNELLTWPPQANSTFSGLALQCEIKT